MAGPWVSEHEICNSCVFYKLLKLNGPILSGSCDPSFAARVALDELTDSVTVAFENREYD